MAEAGSSSVLLIDNDGDSMVNASGELKVSIGADIDIGDVEIKGHESLDEGNNASIGTSATQLTASTTPCKHVDVMAAIANTGIIYIGGAGVTTATGIALYAGDVYSLDIENVNLLYGIASVDTEDVQWVYYN